MNNIEKGMFAEGIACRFLENNGFVIKDRNYRRSWGEIDIVALRQGSLYFIEVKSSFSAKSRPEENVHKTKVRRLRRTIEMYISEGRVAEEWFGREGETDVRTAVIAINISREHRVAKVKFIQTIFA